ncbi:MAG: nicotinate-nucleotide adenylyltransferase [Pseudomonadota bacterium]
MRLGILGGTFDPIHLGHLRAAEEIGQGLNIKKVYLIPSASPPHRIRGPIASFHHRFKMAQMAVGDSSRLEVLDMENRRPGLSYSIETLREFRTLFSPKAEIFFILGTDAFLEIKTWKDYQNLFDYAHFVIIQRAGFQPEGLEALLQGLGVDARKSDQPHICTVPSGNQIMLMKPTLMDISSTRIRETVAQGRSIRFLVPESVRVYIMKNRLYADYASP